MKKEKVDELAEKVANVADKLNEMPLNISHSLLVDELNKLAEQLQEVVKELKQ